MTTKCIHCGKERREYQAGSHNCCIGRKTRAGYIAFHRTQKFTPRPRTKNACPRCKGTGYTDETTDVVCPLCMGTGFKSEGVAYDLQV